MRIFEGQGVIVFRSGRYGWAHNTFDVSDYEPVNKDGSLKASYINPVYGVSGYGSAIEACEEETRQGAIKAALYHLAQNTWRPEFGLQPGFAIHDDKKADFASWAEFQLRYRKARAAGLTSDQDCFDYAARHPQRAAELALLVDKAA